MVLYTPEAMETIRAAAVAGLYKLGRGGLEVGGVLFGRLAKDGVEVLSSRPLVIEHAYGPTFTLSEADHAALAKLVEGSAADPELRGLVTVGWYHSHTRSGLSLTGQDLEIHERYFPETWQTALLLSPEKTASSRAVFFTRGSDGSLSPESLILLEAPPRSRKAVAAPPPPPPRAEVDAPPATVSPAPSAEPVEREPPALLGLPPGARRLNPWPWLLFAVALGVALISTGFAFRSYWLPESPAPLQVRLFDLDGQLSISWDRAYGPVLEAQRGTLEITDGQKQTLIQMTGDHLRKGTAVYSRQSGTVVVRLVLFLPESRQIEGVANFFGQSPKPAAAQETQQLKGELERLQSELEKQNQRNRELDAANAKLRKQVEKAGKQ